MIEQRTPAWFQARCGSLGASSLHEAAAKTKTGWGASRANLMARIVAERLTGVPQESYVNSAMQHGIDTEPEARSAYCFYHDVDVEEVGIVFHPRIKGTHASPDGLVGESGLIEIKCPNTATHIDTLFSQAVPDKYVLQMLWQMTCTGRAWCDFVSYDPRMPEDLRMFVRRVHRDDKRISELEVLVMTFLSEVSEKIAALTALTAPKQAEAA